MHSGRYLAKGETPTAIEAHDDIPQRSVILEFPDQDAVDAFFEERNAGGPVESWPSATPGRILVLAELNG
ncbi:MAG: hypothetical protein CMQ29_03140 [Gammaproteobacteria bacterium]|nr:hypothetical protein [Gammaproteobacteria bacterium]